VAARWGEQGAGPAYQSEVGSALRGLESEREVGEGADARALVWAGLLGCPGKEEKWSGLGRLG
jgi:hypothetical protein